MEFSIDTWEFVSEKKVWNLESIGIDNSLKEISLKIKALN